MLELKLISCHENMDFAKPERLNLGDLKDLSSCEILSFMILVILGLPGLILTFLILVGGIHDLLNAGVTDHNDESSFVNGTLVNGTNG